MCSLFFTDLRFISSDLFFFWLIPTHSSPSQFDNALVAEFFTAAEATIPCLISRSWHNVFVPIVWQRLNTSKECNKMCRSIESVVRNAYRIRELKYYGPHLPPKFFSVPFNRLTCLDFVSLEECVLNESSPIWSQLATLVSRNRQLQQFNVDGQGSSMPLQMWLSLSSTSNFQTLVIDCVSMDSGQLSTLWGHCPRL